MYALLECPNKPINGKERQEIVHRQSDYPIVSQKQGNACGEKALAGIQLEEKDTTPILRNGEWLSTKLSSITIASQRKSRAKVHIIGTSTNRGFPNGMFLGAEKG